MSAVRRPRRHRRLRLEALEDRHLLAALSIIDNGDAGYTQVGSWTPYATAGYNGDLSYAASGGGSTATYTVRRIAHGVGVERTFPVHTPSVAKIEIEKLGKVRRAKLFYLRYRTGKQSKLREQVGEHKEEKA